MFITIVYQPTHLSVYQPTHLSVYQPTHLSVYQPTHLSVYQPTHLSVYQSTHLSVFLFSLIFFIEYFCEHIGYQPCSVTCGQGECGNTSDRVLYSRGISFPRFQTKFISTCNNILATSLLEPQKPPEATSEGLD